MVWRNDERIYSGLDFIIPFLTFPLPSCSASCHRSVLSVAMDGVVLGGFLQYHDLKLDQ